MDFNSIDWNSMWKEESAREHWNKGSQKELWDKRAESFNKLISRVSDGKKELDKDDYISKMLSHIEGKPEWSILDIGCGPGTLAVPLAKKAKSVTALDISSEMLKQMKVNACSQNLSNISCLNCSWQDAFNNQQLCLHDVVVASQSLMSGDMKEAISGINSISQKALYLTLPVMRLPFDWDVYKAIGRNNKKHAPYVYFYNLLFQMGILANVEILYSRVKVQFPSIAAAIEDLQWRTDPFSEEETAKLKNYLEQEFAKQKGSPVFTHEGYSKWALIWWKKENN
jgi:SAM-dependent methyltransferase